MRIIKASVIVALLFSVAEFANAQTSGSQGGSNAGLFGQRTLGSTLSAGNRTFGRNPAPIIGTDSAAGRGNVGGLDASDRFLRQNRQPGQFVGADPAAVQGFIGAVQAGQGGGPTGRAGAISADRDRSENVNQPGRAARRSYSIRASLSVGFPVNEPRASVVCRDLSNRLARCPRLTVVKPLSVVVSNGVVTLGGTVATGEDRVMAEQLVRLEPGVWDVVNEIVVDGR